MSNKLDIFELLRHIDDKDNTFLKSLSDDSRKGFMPVVTLRWLSGSGNNIQLMNLNELVNSTVFNLHAHPELLYRLMTISTPKGRKNYKWIKTPSKRNTTMRNEVLMRYLNCSPHEAKEFANLYTSEDIIEMCESLGETAEFMKKLKSELK